MIEIFTGEIFEAHITRRKLLELAVGTCTGLAFAGCLGYVPSPPENVSQVKAGGALKLVDPKIKGDVSLEETLLKRRSIRTYSGRELTIEEVSQLLWSAQGITSPWGGRTAPSAGALYPLELYLVSGNTKGLDKGVYRYKSDTHELVKVLDGDVREALGDAAVGQSSVKEAAVDIVFSAVYSRTTSKYGERGFRYVHMEAGHAAQNVYLQAVSLNLGAVIMGAFIDGKVKEILNIQEEPLYIMPVGRKS